MLSGLGRNLYIRKYTTDIGIGAEEAVQQLGRLPAHSEAGEVLKLDGKRPEIGTSISTRVQKHVVRGAIVAYFTRRNVVQDEAEWGIFMGK